jgi:4-methyl-5(b-hydroxyethyl)-thiazole monophosphate biosynthesis
MTRALVPLADGVEEMEAVIAIDTLRRAGWEVTAAGLRPGPVTASRGVRLLPDAQWKDIDPSSFDVLVLPGGGEGTAALCRDARVLGAVKEFMASGRLVGAICAAPLVLDAAGALDGRKFTCYPGIESRIRSGIWAAENVVVDGNLVTSRAAGTSFDFAIALIAARDPARAQSVAEAMLVGRK